MIDRIEEMEKSTEQIVSFLEGLEAAARKNLAEKSDEEAVDQIIATAWYQ